jgi:ATPase subunit of ABC transporter with duplicated ATPase domains
LQNFSEIILFSSHDHTLVQTVANRIIEILPGGIVDKMMPYDDYLADPEVQAQREAFGALRQG